MRALGVRQPEPSGTQLLPKDAILLPEVVDPIFVVAIRPASNGEQEELQGVGHCVRLLGRDG